MNININTKERQVEIDRRNQYKICFACKEKKDLINFKFNIKQEYFFGRCHPCEAKARIIIETKSRIKRREKLNNTSREYRKTNKAKEYYRKRKIELRKNDTLFKIKELLSKRLRNALIASGLGKHIRTIDLLGCSIIDFRKYLESNFKNGMNWQNRGCGNNAWHIDHLLPCELFDLSDDRQQRVCFNYKNMTPCWHVDNITKSDYLDNGRRARDLTPREKLDYLKSKGYDFTKPFEESTVSAPRPLPESHSREPLLIIE